MYVTGFQLTFISFFFSFSHAWLEFTEQIWSKEFKTCKASHLKEVKSLVSILQYIFLGLELVHYKILVILVIDLKFSNPGIERCQDLLLADDILADHGFRVHIESVVKYASYR